MNNIMSAMNENDEPMVTPKMCNSFFERYWKDAKTVEMFLKNNKFL